MPMWCSVVTWIKVRITSRVAMKENGVLGQERGQVVKSD